jgi:hypothetical protein
MEFGNKIKTRDFCAMATESEALIPIDPITTIDLFLKAGR